MPSETQLEQQERDTRYRQLASFLRSQRKEKNLDADELARRAGILLGTYQTYERLGQAVPAMPKFDVALRIIQALGCRVEDAASAMGIDLERQLPARSQAVRKARRERHWSEQQLADELGTTLRMIKGYESGDVPVPSSVIEQIFWLPKVTLPIPGTVPDDVSEDEEDRLREADALSDGKAALEPRDGDHRARGGQRRNRRVSDDD